MKTVALAQQSTSLNARQAGQELVLSTLAGALLAFALWMGLSLWPSLLMLVLMLSLMTLWLARRLIRLVAGRFPPSFWSNAWITARTAPPARMCGWRRPCVVASIWWWPAMAGCVSCCSSSGGRSAAHWQKPS